MIDYPIDIVIPWVDGADPAWQKEHDKYSPDKISDNSSARFRDWNLMKYWFRSVEQYAPWVRTIHFVTYGHLPSWLNTENPKLHIVNHTDYIPEQYLPTFSSHPIELNMHRISGLSEHFVYFNDDVYFSQPTCPEDFFKNGLPADTACFGVVKNADIANFMPYIYLNMLAVINMRFSKREMLKRDLTKWITPKNGKAMLYNLYLLPWGEYTGFRNYHSGTPFLKSTFDEVWEEYPVILDRTCGHRFRSKEDVNQYLMRYWQLCTGKFVPRKPNNAYYTVGMDDFETIKASLYNKKYKIVCINDDPLDFDFDKEQKRISQMLEEKYPDKSSFERN